MDEPADDGGFSRRTFLKGATGIAVLGTMPGGLEGAPPTEAVSGIPQYFPVRLKVNGAWHQVRVSCRTTLGQLLRNELGLTGTKLSCESGECGACTVMVDGQAINSCLRLAIDADGAEVTTIEGLAEGDQLHPIQQAFVDTDALQCGYCTPGQIMACLGLLTRDPHPDDTAIRHGMSGNLCRCGAYANILEAVRQAAARGGGSRG